jgi:hypothetical protein
MPENNPTNKNAVDALFWREEILQVLYWMECEGLETAVPFNRLMVLLNSVCPKTRLKIVFHPRLKLKLTFLSICRPCGSSMFANACLSELFYAFSIHQGMLRPLSLPAFTVITVYAAALRACCFLF